VDSAFYACPSARTVSNWAARTPEGFIFSVKVPQVITHEKVLADCDSEFEEFVKTMDILGPKLGPMVFQFPFFVRWKFPKQDSFLAVLVPFLKKLPADHKFVVEIRNKTWLDTGLADVLREHNVALALSDTSFMPRPWEFKEKFDLITADLLMCACLSRLSASSTKYRRPSARIIKMRKDRLIQIPHGDNLLDEGQDH
jgi:uncharacterized protein YecE (DUF72 family)